MIRRFVLLAAVAATVVVAAASAEAQIAQTSRCADCHFANPDAPGRRHLLDWDLSPHGRANVGCEACHGGDASTFESLLAHRDLVPFGAPDGPLTPRNLPRTCGVCHAGPFVAFQDSRHYEMLRNGDRSAPTCATCHGDTAAGLLSARALESRCSSCHGPGETAPRDRRAQQVRELYEEVAFARADLKQAQSLIRRVEAGARRQALDEAYQQAEVPLIQAIQAGHRFVYDDFTERLAVARERTEALLEQLANP
jgi:hypothetical protein